MCHIGVLKMLREGSVTCKSAGWMPITLAALLATGMIVSYIWAVIRKDVVPWLPFISDAGGNPPQSGFFAIFLFLSATMGLLTMLVRYTALYYETYRLQMTWMRRLNHGSLLIGFFCLFGMLLVAAYPVHSSKLPKNNNTAYEEQENEWKTTVLFAHTFGAMLCFWLGIVYSVCQTVLSYVIRPALAPGFWQGKHLHLLITRTAACCCALAATLVMFLLKNDRSLGGDPWASTPNTRGKAIAEWLLALMLAILFITLYPEMKTLKIGITAETPPCECDTQRGQDQFGSAHQSVPTTNVYT